MKERVNCYHNPGELSLEYFLNHIPTSILKEVIRNDLGVADTNMVYALRDAIMSAGVSENNYIAHVDTQLRGNTWRVQLRIRMHGRDIAAHQWEAGIISFLCGLNSPKIINSIKSSFGYANGILTFSMPWVG